MTPFFTSNLFYTVLLMLVAGILGGIVNGHYTPNERGEPNYLRKCILVGTGASLLMPLFLYLIRSRLLDDILAEAPANPTNASASSVGVVQGFLVFFSFCLLASISAFRFIPALSDKLFDLLKRVDEKATVAVEEGQRAQVTATIAVEKVQQAEVKAMTAAETVKRVEAKANANRQTLRAVKGQIAERNPIRRKTDVAATLTRADPLKSYHNPKPVTYPDDPQKGRWGGKTGNDHCEVNARVTALDQDEDWFEVVLTVTSTDPAPLGGEVVFFLHDSFANPEKKVEAKDGQAVVSLTSWGAFTVGVLVNGKTELEIDLSADDVDAPAAFKQR